MDELRCLISHLKSSASCSKLLRTENREGFAFELALLSYIKIISSEHAVRRQLTSKMRLRNPFMELSDVLTTQDGIKAFLVTQDSLLLCFAFLGSPTYQAALEKCSFFTTFEVVKPSLFEMYLFQQLSI